MSIAGERSLGIQWVVATIVGWAIGFFVCEALKAFVSTLFVDGLVIGAFVGVAQGLVVRRRIAPMGWWVLASILGFGVGLAAGEAVGPGVPLIVGRALIGTIIGLAVGVAQWLVLRRQVARAEWWILASVVGWILAWIVIRSAEASENQPIVLVYLLGGSGAAVAGIITGAALIWLSRSPRGRG